MTDDWIIRSAGVADLAALAGLRRAYSQERHHLEPGGDPSFETGFAEWFRASGDQSHWWIAELDGQPIGMLQLWILPRMPAPGYDTGSWAYLSLLFVLATHRDRGVGSALLDAGVAAARLHQVTKLLLSPSQRARPLYLRHGFESASSHLLLRP